MVKWENNGKMKLFGLRKIIRILTLSKQNY